MIGGIASGVYGVSKEIGFDPIDAVGGIFGGGEEGSGQTQPNTLAHAIDKLDNANDPEALALAPEAVQVYNQSGLTAAQRYIDEQLGYSFSGPYSSGKWEYINRMLKKEARESSNQQQQTGTTTGPGYGGRPTETSEPQTAGQPFGVYSEYAKYGIGVAVFAILVYMVK